MLDWELGFGCYSLDLVIIFVSNIGVCNTRTAILLPVALHPSALLTSPGMDLRLRVASTADHTFHED